MAVTFSFYSVAVKNLTQHLPSVKCGFFSDLLLLFMFALGNSKERVLNLMLEEVHVPSTAYTMSQLFADVVLMAKF